MPTYINNAGNWVELSGSDRPYLNVSGNWQGAKNIYAKVSGTWQTVYQYDNTGPSISDWTIYGDDSNQMTFAWSGGALVTDSESGVVNVFGGVKTRVNWDSKNPKQTVMFAGANMPLVKGLALEAGVSKSVQTIKETAWGLGLSAKF